MLARDIFLCAGCSRYRTLRVGKVGPKIISIPSVRQVNFVGPAANAFRIRTRAEASRDKGGAHVEPEFV